MANPLKSNTNLFQSLARFNVMHRLHGYETPAEKRRQFCIGVVLSFFGGAGAANISPREMEKILKHARNFSRIGLDRLYARYALYLRALRVAAVDERRRFIFSVENAFNSQSAVA